MGTKWLSVIVLDDSCLVASNIVILEYITWAPICLKGMAFGWMISPGYVIPFRLPPMITCSA